jgi:DNA repair protein RecO (recombination protein O)
VISTKGFVLRTFKYAESDLIVHVLTQTGEKLKLFARSAMKSKKRFGGGVLEPTHYISFSYKPSRNEEGLGQLLEANIIQGFEGLRSDYDRIQTALHFVSLVDKLSLEGVEDGKPLFDLLGNALTATQVAKHLMLLRVQFELKLLYTQGVLPSIPNAQLLLERQMREALPDDFDPQIERQLQIESETLLQRYLHR